MILFDRLVVKNFGSFGNAPTEIDLTLGMVLVQGRNGTGKSTLVTDALTFVLYGKPFKKINLPQLVNNMNGRDCVVTLDFRIRGTNSTFKVIRGLKPGIFEIYRDGVLIPQEAAMRDYQSYLENEILKVSYRAFTQILVMGSAQYTPFMHLSPGNRRAFIDELLDTKLLATMGMLVKGKIKEVDRELEMIGVKLSGYQAETKNKKSLLDKMVENTESRSDGLLVEIEKLDFQLACAHETMEAQTVSYKEALVVYQEEYGTERTGRAIEVASLKKQMSDIQKEQRLFEELCVCGTCKQSINETHRKAILSDISIRHMKAEKEYAQENYEHSLYLEWVEKRAKALAGVDKHKDAIDSTKDSISELQIKRSALVDEMNRLKSNSDTDIEVMRESIRETVEMALETIAKKDSVSIHKTHLMTSKDVLSDSGIKSRIISVYLPIINKHVSEILNDMDMFVQFSLDENFNETILHRGREDMSYASLSEGEKRRVDLALLYAFRQIVMMKESGGVDLLVLDEMDSGLDFDGRAKFLELVRKMSPNSWVISHAIRGSGLETEFDRIVAVDKVGDFTVIKEE